MDKGKGKGKGKGIRQTFGRFYSKNFTSNTKDSGSSSSRQKSSYRVLSPYIQKLNPLHIYFLDQTAEALQ